MSFYAREQRKKPSNRTSFVRIWNHFLATTSWETFEQEDLVEDYMNACEYVRKTMRLQLSEMMTEEQFSLMKAMQSSAYDEFSVEDLSNITGLSKGQIIGRMRYMVESGLVFSYRPARQKITMYGLTPYGKQEYAKESEIRMSDIYKRIAKENKNGQI